MQKEYALSPDQIRRCLEKGEGLAPLFMQAQALDQAGDPRLALEYLDTIAIAAIEAEEHLIAGHAMLKQSEIYNRLGVPMSRDGYALAAAEEFREAEEYDAVQTALNLIPSP